MQLILNVFLLFLLYNCSVFMVCSLNTVSLERIKLQQIKGVEASSSEPGLCAKVSFQYLANNYGDD